MIWHIYRTECCVICLTKQNNIDYLKAGHRLAYDSENDEWFSTSYEAPYKWLG